MNALLLSLGLALLAVLSGALAAPFFIDWSSQRGFFEARAAEVLGRPVEFAGPLEVRIVPFPRLTAHDVRIGDPASQLEGAERVIIRAALAPLLSGELEITDMVLTRPRVTLTLDEGGRLSWAAERGDQVLPLPAERTRLERLEVIEGAVVVENVLAGTTIEMTGLNLTGSAGSLAGPFRVEGGGLVDGRRYTLRIGTGRIQQDGAMRFTASVVPADRPLTVELDGSLELNANMPGRFRGGVVVAQPAVNAGVTPWRVEGDVMATASKVVAEALTVSIGPETERLALAGEATLDLGAEPRFDVSMTARQLDFDRAYGAGADSPATLGETLKRIAALFDATAHLGPGQLSLDVGSVVLAGNLVEGLDAELTLGAEGWHIAGVRAQGPGLTDVQFSGALNSNGGAPALDGRLRLDSRQAGALAAWLFGPDVRLPGFGAVAGPLEVAADLSIAEDAISLTGLEIVTADARLSGEIAYAGETESGRPALVAQIETDRLSFDGLRRSAGASPLADLVSLIAGTDFDLAINAGAIHVGGVDLNEVTLVVALSDGDMRVDRLRIGDLGDARIDGHGAIRDIAGAPGGRLEAAIAAESLHAVSEVLSALGLPEAADALDRRAGVLVPVELDLSFDAGGDGATGSRADIAVVGTAGGTSLDLAIGFEGRTDRLLEGEVALSLEADNPDGARLIEQIGLFPAHDVPAAGRLTFTARGRPDRAMAFTLTAGGLGIDGKAEGDLRLPPRGGPELSGSFTFDLASPADLFGGMGLGPALADAPPLALAGRLTAADSVWRLSELAASVDGLEARGHLAFDLGAAAPVADGRFELSRLDLPRLLGALLGPDAFAPADAATGEAWPREAFAPADLAGLRGRIGLSAPQLDLGGGFVARDGGFDLHLAPGRVVIERVHGGLFGGRLSGDMELASLDGAMQLEGRVELDGARLEELAWRGGGRAVAAGTLSLGAELSATGRSLLGLVSTLSGSGSLRVEDGVIRRMNPRAFDHIVRAADAGLELEEEDVRRVFASHLDAGSLHFDQAEGSFTLAGGVARTRSIRLDGAPLQSFASATVDLTRLDLHSEWLLRVAAPEAEGRMREAAIVFVGPVTAPRRDIDVAPLLGYLTVRAFEQEVQRLEELQTEIHMREWRRHELMRFGRDLRRFERERADRLRRTEEAALEAARDEEAASETEVEDAPVPPAGEPAAAANPAPSTGIEQLVRDALRATADNAENERPRSLVPAPTPTPPPSGGQPMNIVPPLTGTERTTR